MKYKEKRKTIKNIGRELLQEIFILKIVEKRGNFMKTEKNYAYIFLLFWHTFLEKLQFFCGVALQVTEGVSFCKNVSFAN